MSKKILLLLVSILTLVALANTTSATWWYSYQEPLPEALRK